MAANAPPANAAALLNADTVNTLSAMYQDANGDYVYSNDKALYGYISAGEYLVLPKAFHDNAKTKVDDGTGAKDFPKVGLDVFGGRDGIKQYLGGSTEGTAYRNSTLYKYYDDEVLITQIAFLNYLKLREFGIEPADAYVVAALRTRWIALGAYNVTATDDSRPYKEVMLVEPDDNGTEYQKVVAATTVEDIFDVNLARAIEYVAQANNATRGIKWVIENAEAIWGAEEHVVRVRGHHYKNSYDTLLTKYIQAWHEGEGAIPADLTMSVLFRTSIHSFGLKALPVMAGHFAIHGKMANSGILRFSGAPNGMAVVTTTAACLRAMSGEPWYGRFRHIYGEQIDLLEDFESNIMANKFGFHMSARLYGVPSVTSVIVNGQGYTTERMREVGANLASLAQGFVQAMQAAVESGSITTFSFSAAKAMEKYAANNPLSALRIRGLILYAIDAISEAKSVNQATRAALPFNEEDNKTAEAGGG